MSAKKNAKRRPLNNSALSSSPVLQEPVTVSEFVEEVTPEIAAERNDNAANSNQNLPTGNNCQQIMQSCCQFIAANWHMFSARLQEAAEALWHHNQQAFNEFLTCQTYDQWCNFNNNYWQKFGSIMQEAVTQIQQHCNENFQEALNKCN